MCTLLEITLDLLEGTEETLTEIGTSTGLPYEWLKKLKYRKISDPSVGRIQTLYEHLSGQALELK